VWAKARSASRPRSKRTWGPECQLRGRAGKSLARGWSWANGFRRTRQQGSRGAVLKGRADPEEPKRVRRVGEKKGKGRCAAGRLLVRGTKRESYRGTATRAKTKFYSYSRTRTTRMSIYDDVVRSVAYTNIVNSSRMTVLRHSTVR
jgi:hypothetical protein